MPPSLQDKIYATISKWKLGEIQALAGLTERKKQLVLPLFVVPSGDAYDHEELRIITAAEHIKYFGARLYTHWGNRPCFVDASHLSMKHSENGSHPLAALLQRGRLAGARPGPAVMLNSTPAYIEAAKRFLTFNDDANFCLRLTLSTFDDPEQHDRIRHVLEALECEPNRGCLMIDGGALLEWDDSLVDILIDNLNELPALLEWNCLFFSSTSFPNRRVKTPGTVGRYPRSDRKLYNAIYDRRGDLARLPRFSDYGTEFPSNFTKGGGAAQAHLRFTGQENYLISEGQSVKGNGNAAIWPVAKELIRQSEFHWAPASSGIDYISLLAERLEKGNPSTWRRAAADIHLINCIDHECQRLSISTIETVTEDAELQPSLL
jgi:hypothetical protein